MKFCNDLLKHCLSRCDRPTNINVLLEKAIYCVNFYLLKCQYAVFIERDLRFKFMKSIFSETQSFQKG